MIDRKKLPTFLSDPSLLLAIVATGIYYAVVFSPMMRGGILFNYTAQHAIEYVIVGMFMWGMIDVLLKVTGMPREFMAMSKQWIAPQSGRVPASQAKMMLDQVEANSPTLLESRIAQRIRQALSYVVENKSAEGFPEHLRYLADQDHDKTYIRYTLVSFVVAVTPILGFLGTVVHFGTALSGMSIDKMESQLSHVVSEMGTAFNTTTVALGAAMATMFAKFLCERSERRMLTRIDLLVARELENRFEVKPASMAPMLTILQTANQEFHATVQTSLNQQLDLWAQALEALFESFDKRQKAEEQRWNALCANLQDRGQTIEASFSGNINELAKTLNGIAQGKGQLAEVQKSLADNLRILHETNQIDAALHGLTAAIHLLTAKNPASAGAKSKAA